MNDNDIDKINYMIENFTGADIDSMVNESCYYAIRDGK